MNGKVRFVLLAIILLAAAPAWGQTPPPLPETNAPETNPVATQPKETPPKEERPPELAQETNGMGSEGRLDFSDTRLPQPPEMLGDVPPAVLSVVPVVIQLPSQILQITTRNPNGEPITRTVVIPGGTVVIPGAAVPTSGRGFKIADDGSPRPQDRVFLDFNFFNDLFAASNLRLGNTVQNFNLYRESLGVEKTFLDRTASVGLALPLNTVTMESVLPNLNGTHTALGDLTAFCRYALWRDEASDNWLTAGLAITVPTGPSAIAGIDAPTISHSTIFQPYVGALWNFGSIYLQGFFAVDTPTDSRDVTLLYSDLGIGYFLYRSWDPGRLLTALAPTVEVHSSNPVNHRGLPSLENPLASFDFVDIGLGANVQFRGRFWLALEAVTPVTGPRPFTIEALAQFRIHF